MITIVEWLPMATPLFHYQLYFMGLILCTKFNVQPITNYGLFCLIFQYNEILPNSKNYNSFNNNSQILNAYK